MPSSQPVRQLFLVTVHLGTEIFESQAVDLFIPGQPFQRGFGTGNGVVTEESDDPGDMPQIDSPAVLPVPDRGGRDVNLRCDLFLVESEFKTPAAQVVTEGDGLPGKLGRGRNFQGNCDFEGWLG